MEGVVRVNVGGRVFCTTARTLLSGGERTLFHRLLQGEGVGVVRDEQGAVFVDRSDTYFAPLLELLRTGLLWVDSKDEHFVPRMLLEADFYGVTDRFLRSVNPVGEGLFLGQSEGDTPFLVVLETAVQRSHPQPVQVLVTGVIDEAVLLRCPVVGLGAFLKVPVRDELVCMSPLPDSKIACCGLGVDRVLQKQETLCRDFPTDALPLRTRLLRNKSKGKTTVLYFDEDRENSQMLLWKVRPDSRSTSYVVTVLCSKLFLFSSMVGRDYHGFLFLSGRVIFLVKRNKEQKKEGYCTVIALERERAPRVANLNELNNNN